VPGYNVAYVGNIAFEADVNDLRELMSDCDVTKVRMHTDKDTGKFKGYAHVHFADDSQAVTPQPEVDLPAFHSLDECSIPY
jgi:nucleolin